MAHKPGTAKDREAFRIDDETVLEYQLATEEEINHQLLVPNNEDPKQHLLSALAKLDHEAGSLTSGLKDVSSELSDYFRIINRKIDLVAHAFCFEHEELSQTQPHYVSLSETGIAFHTIEQFNDNDILKIQLLLKPSLHRVLVLAKVIDSSKPGITETNKSHQPYYTAVQITYINGTDHQLLAKHIFKKQAEQLRAAKAEKESSKSDI